MKHFLAILLAFTLVAAACGGDDDTAAGADSSSTTDDSSGDDSSGDDNSGDDNSGDDDGPEFSGGGSGSFCDKARSVDENDPLQNASILDGEQFFADMDETWGQVASMAPPEIKGDIDTLFRGLDVFKDLFEKYGYNLLDPELQAEMEDFDSSELDVASANLDKYLEDVCGIDRSSDIENSGPGLDITQIDPDALEDLDPAGALALLTALGVDQETAECFVEELGDELEGFDPQNPDISILSQPVCGTTLLALLGGLGGS